MRLSCHFLPFLLTGVSECKHILSRMLVTNPANRATLQEVMSHPWMVRGFMGPPAIHLVQREPLRADDLDRQVIKGMKGFDFGTDDDVEKKLIKVLESESYQRAVREWERKRGLGANGFGANGNGTGAYALSNSSLNMSIDGSQTRLDVMSSVSSTSGGGGSKKGKRFSGFDYYRRKLFSPAASPPGSPSTTTGSFFLTWFSSNTDMFRFRRSLDCPSRSNQVLPPPDLHVLPCSRETRTRPRLRPGSLCQLATVDGDSRHCRPGCLGRADTGDG